MTNPAHQAVEAAVQQIMGLTQDVCNADVLCAANVNNEAYWGFDAKRTKAKEVLADALRAALARPLEVAAPVSALAVFHQAWGDAKGAPNYNKAAFGYVLPFFDKAASRVPVASVAEPLPPSAMDYALDILVAAGHITREKAFQTRDIARQFYSGSSDHLAACAGGGVTQWQPITGAGQVKAGDALQFTIGDDRYSEVAKEILHAGTSVEEILYNKKRNYYLITSMAMENKGSQKNVRFKPAPRHDAPTSQIDEQAAFEEWLARVCPSGDVTEVQNQWLASSDYEEWASQIKIRTYCEDCGKSVSDEPDGIHTCSPQYGKPANRGDGDFDASKINGGIPLSEADIAEFVKTRATREDDHER